MLKFAAFYIYSQQNKSHYARTEQCWILYRDDDLGIFRNLSRPDIERKKKDIIKMFKSFGLSVTVTTNVTSANYLDVNFDLTKDIYKPYRKPNDEPVYINRHSTIPQTL